MPSNDTYRHQTPIQVRISDTDALGHVNNATFATYAETARLDFWPTIGGTLGNFILAHQSIDFRRQVRFRDSVRVTTWMDKIGRTSIVLRHEVLACDQIAAEIKAVIVYFDYAVGAPAEVPDSIRAFAGQRRLPDIPEPTDAPGAGS